MLAIHMPRVLCVCAQGGFRAPRFKTGVAGQREDYLDKPRGSVLHQDGRRKRGNKHFSGWLV